MALHRLEPGEGAVYGAYSGDIAPALTIDSGDTVRLRTLDAGWNVDPWDQECKPGRKHPRDPARDRGHALTGPVAVRGARPGMTLAVHIDSLLPATWAWSGGGGGPWGLNREFGTLEGPEVRVRWQIDREAGNAVNQFGHRIRIRPFLGNLGMPPAEPGFHSTVPPRPNGGNFDCKELVAGSTLYLPVSVPGALFFAGDGHAAQGDGEIAGPALECGMEQVDLTFDLMEGLDLPLPRAHTPVGWITFGFDPDLNVAMVQAVNGMLDLMEQQYGLSRKAALALGTAVVDLRITQVVNEVRGVHALLPHDAIEWSKGDCQ